MFQMTQFDNNFLSEFSKIGETVLKQYSQTVEAYQKHIIPFEKNRIKENQTLAFKNTSLQQNKFQLLSKIEQLTSENNRLQYTLQKQQLKIHQLQRNVDSLTKTKQDHESIIESLKMLSSDLESSLNLKVKIIKQVETDKQTVLKNYQQKNNDYNQLLSQFMKDKNFLAEKLNQINELEQSLLQKQRQIKSQQFILQKQIQQFQQSKKNTPDKILSVIPDRVERRPIFKQDEKEQKGNKHLKNEILKTPLKKIYKHHQNQIYDITFNYNGNLVATCGGDRCVKIYDVLNVRSGITIQSNSAQSVFVSSALNYGGDRLLTGSTDKTVQIYSTQSGKQLHSFVGHGEKINSVTWSCTKQKCISGADDRQIKIWQIEKASNILSISCGKSVKVVTSNTVEPVVYSGHTDGSIRIYSINQGTSPVSQIKGILDYPINQISLLSNRYQVLVSSQQGSIVYLLDLKMNKAVAKYEHKDYFNTSMRADISPTQSFVVAGNCDGAIYYWNKDNKAVEKRVSGHDGPVTTLKYHFMSGVMASADSEGNLILWQ